MYQNKKISKKELLILFLIASTIFVFFQYPALLNHTTLNDDVRFHYYPIYKLKDPSLFQDDLTTELFIFETPKLFTAIIFPLSYLFNLILLSKIMSFILFLLTTLFVYKFAKLYLKTNMAYFCTTIFLTLIWSFPSISGGLPRAFSFLLIFAFLHYSSTQNYTKKAITLIISLLIYPVALFITWTSYLLLKLKDMVDFLKHKILKKDLKFFIIITFLLLALGFIFYSGTNNSKFGELAGYNTISTDPAFSEEGRLQIFPIKSFPQLAFDYIPFFLILNLTLLIPFLIINKKSTFKLPKELWALFIAGMLLHYIAGFAGLKLHFYTRYARYTFPIFLTFFFSKNIELALSKIKKKHIQVLILILIAIATIFTILPSTAEHLIACNKIDVYDFLSTADKDSMTAGHPLETDCIPLFSKRKVFTSKEAIAPGFLEYKTHIENRTFEFLKAFYSTNTPEIVKFCEENTIDYLLVDYKYLNNPASYFRMEPFYSFVINMTSNKSNFILKTISDEKKIIKNQDYYLIECRELKNEE